VLVLIAVGEVGCGVERAGWVEITSGLFEVELFAVLGADRVYLFGAVQQLCDSCTNERHCGGQRGRANEWVFRLHRDHLLPSCVACRTPRVKAR
jgi:hypothetical protein